MNESNASIIFLMSVVMLVGCSTSTRINYLQPAQVQIIGELHDLAVLPFNDSQQLGISEKIDSALYNKKVLGQKYFNVLDPSTIANIASQKGIAVLDITNKKYIYEIGRALNVQAGITGWINAFHDNTVLPAVAIRCDEIDYECKEVLRLCSLHTYGIRGEINVYHINTERKIHSAPFFEKTEYEFCRTIEEERSVLGSIISTLSKANEIREDSKWRPSEHKYAVKIDGVVERFLRDITPGFTSINIELPDEPTIKYNNQQKKLLKNGLKLAKKKRFAQGEEVFTRLLNSVNNRCHVAAFNLGVMQEGQQKFDEALQTYKLSVEISGGTYGKAHNAINRVNNQKQVFNKVFNHLEAR